MLILNQNEVNFRDASHSSVIEAVDNRENFKTIRSSPTSAGFGHSQDWAVCGLAPSHMMISEVLCIAMGEIGVLPLFPITVLLHAGFIGFFSNVRSDRLLAELRHSPWKEVARVGCQLNASTS